jgi:hypothetical protein
MTSKLNESVFGKEAPSQQKKKILSKVSNVTLPTSSEDLLQKDLLSSLDYEEILDDSLDAMLFKKDTDQKK